MYDKNQPCKTLEKPDNISSHKTLSRGNFTRARLVKGQTDSTFKNI
ncbi:hypothetical protein NMS_0896 [Nonlabens marinus S1-08]|uniref:Uncharacterized protein n=1 Tax=Nonlabens marinus S1-08 TaxID=1454201 RepID=W8VQ76_9FLAO|nr:hypothetical protein NMS_0896 [Nonlabens marinus S1-08]